MIRFGLVLQCMSCTKPETKHIQFQIGFFVSVQFFMVRLGSVWFGRSIFGFTITPLITGPHCSVVTWGAFVATVISFFWCDSYILRRDCFLSLSSRDSSHRGEDYYYASQNTTRLITTWRVTHVLCNGYDFVRARIEGGSEPSSKT